MNHKEMTAHIRKRVKVCRIKARVRLYTSCGFQWINVFVVEHGLYFSPSECRKIATIADVNGLTYVQGIKIECDESKFPNGRAEFHFIFHK